MSPQAKALRDRIRDGKCDPQTIAAELNALPRSDIMGSTTLLSAWASFATDDPRQKLAALAHVARMSQNLALRPRKGASVAAEKSRDAKWASKFGPGFNLHLALGRIAIDLGIPLVAIDDDGKRRFIGKPDQKKIVQVLRDELARDFPQKWAPDVVPRPKLYVDPSAFQDASELVANFGAVRFERGFDIDGDIDESDTLED